MVQYLTGSAWSVTMRRIVENIMVTHSAWVCVVHSDRCSGMHAAVSVDPCRCQSPAKPLVAQKRRYLNTEASSYTRRHLFRALEPLGAGIYSIHQAGHTSARSTDARHLALERARSVLLVMLIGTLAAFDWMHVARSALVFDHLRPLLSLRAALWRSSAC